MYGYYLLVEYLVFILSKSLIHFHQPYGLKDEWANLADGELEFFRTLT